MSPFHPFRRWKAKRKLQRIVDTERNSFAIRDYKKRRASALKAVRHG